MSASKDVKMSGSIFVAGKDPITERANVQSFSTTECSESGVILGASGCIAEVDKCKVIYPSNGSGPAETRIAREDRKAQELRFSQEFVEGLEARFTERCKIGLGLDGQALDRARQLFRETRPLFLADAGTFVTTSAEEAERLWTACILYVFKKLSLNPIAGGSDRDPGFTLNQLFDVTDLRVSDFCNELPYFVPKAGSTLAALYGDDCEKRLEITEWRSNYFHLAVLYDNYNRFYHDFFLLDTSSSIDISVSGGSPNSNQMQFGWILFIAFRIHALGRFPDLVTSINGLLAVCMTLILHMPFSLRRFSFQDRSIFVSRNSGGINLLSSFCFLFHAEEKYVTNLLSKLNSMIEIVYKIQGSREFPCAEIFSGVNTENLLYFDGLMEDKYLASNLQVVEKFYEDAYSCQGEFDGRVFLKGDDYVHGAISVCTSNASGSKWEGDSQTSPTQGGVASQSQRNGSPSSSPTFSSLKIGATEIGNRIRPRTIRGTMSISKWLRTVIGPLPEEPSEELQLFFRSCDHDITEDVRYRLQVLLDAIFMKDVSKNEQSLGNWDSSLMDDTWVEQQQSESLKIYYRVLDCMCRAESQRLRSKNLTALLSNETFHRCMVACSAELVLATHKTVTMLFPAVVSRSGITAFDLIKVIESFVRNEETLPRELKRHLNSIEERVLESMAWEKGSSMYNLLVVARPNLAKEINQLGLLASPMPSLETLGSFQGSMPGKLQSVIRVFAAEDVSGGPISPKARGLIISEDAHDVVAVKNEPVDELKPSGFVSPRNKRPSAFSTFSSERDYGQSPLQSAFASPQRASPIGGGETCAETVINIFLQKVLKLAASRIRTLCQSLCQSDYVIEQVYQVFQQALQDVPSLFFNRHIDQIIMCTIYGVCKVRKGNITFREIIIHYKCQPHAKPHVFRNVFINLTQKEGKPTGKETVDLVRFYNEVFVHATKCILFYLGKTLASVSNNSQDIDEGEKTEGRGFESPRKALFPTIPDISPKKVSANQNVYVSALPSAKVEALFSPNSKSLYACVGQSTHAFQSPSKDLIAINNQLNNRCSEVAVATDSLAAGSIPCTSDFSDHSSQGNVQSAYSTVDSIVSECQSLPLTASACAASPFKKPRRD
ncbi:hypothetical protein O6H91_10G107400 [Diphasiastrum complanatum]|uniref:Uncharacterized protein n=2 Tax=Diphasiastrum complanatum TaxID=34168 RepID=A0ACC2CKF1_DIPCM|nr:hypothetical protein O6H91_10G107400 [Diphasiastrum complanatum]KAJ7542453.1 hypothetical protein O6H91_10G107400 [Diphasiastrum complanatum]